MAHMSPQLLGGCDSHNTAVSTLDSELIGLKVHLLKNHMSRTRGFLLKIKIHVYVYTCITVHIFFRG